MHAAGVNADPATFEHVDPQRWSGNARDLPVSELSGRGTVRAQAAGRAIDLDDDGAQRVLDRVKELEHRGYHFEAADGSFELLLRKEAGEYEPLFRLESWRAIVEKRADGRVETEATIKIWVDGERHVRTAEGNGPGQRARPRAARGDRRDPPRAGAHRAGQLQGPHPRRGQGHGRGHAGAARRLRRRGGVGLDRRLGERHRGVVGRARRLAGAGDAGRAGRRRDRGAGPRAARVSAGGAPEREPIPLARPAARRGRGGRGDRGAALRAPVAGAARRGLRARLRRTHRRPARERRVQRHGGPAPGAARGRGGGGRRGDHVAVLVRGLRERGPLRARAAGVRRHRSGHAEPRPAGRRGGRRRAHGGPAAGAHLRLPGRRGGARAPRPPDRRGRLRGARRGATPRA